ACSTLSSSIVTMSSGQSVTARFDKSPPSTQTFVEPIVFQKGINSFQLYIVNNDGTGVTQLIPGSAFDPAWSPDGRRMAFASDRDRTTATHVMNANGATQTRPTSD